MRKPGTFLIVFALAALLGCMKNVAPPLTGDLGKKPSIPPLALDPGKGAPPVFGPPDEFAGSPVAEVGRKGMFDVHEPESSRIASISS